MSYVSGSNLTNPSSHSYLFKALFRVVEALEWKAFIMVYSDDTYGADGAASVLAEARRSPLRPCPVDTIAIARNKPADYYEDIVRRMLEADVTGVVFFGILTSYQQLGTAMQHVEGAGRFHFIIADRDDAQTITVPYSLGLITTSLTSRQIPELQDYFLSMDLSTQTAQGVSARDFYMQVKQCRLPGAEQPDEWPQCPYPSEEERRREYVQERFTEAAVLAVYSYAKALKLAHQDKCDGERGLCQDLVKMSSREFFTDYLKTLDMSFGEDERVDSLASNPEMEARLIRFDSKGDIGQTDFNILNLQNVDGVKQFVKVRYAISRGFSVFASVTKCSMFMTMEPNAI